MTDYSDLPDVDTGGGTATATEDDVLEAMKDVVDPELGINVVDLGLVYDVHLDEGSNVVLDMTLTSAAAPLSAPPDTPSAVAPCRPLKLSTHRANRAAGTSTSDPWDMAATLVHAPLATR